MKKKFIIATGLLTGAVILLDYFGSYLKPKYCGYGGHICKEIYNEILVLGVIFLSILMVSLIAARLTEASFRKFVQFTVWGYIVYSIGVLLTPWDIGSGLAGPSFSKGLMALLLSLVYFIVAIIYILILKQKEKK